MDDVPTVEPTNQHDHHTPHAEHAWNNSPAVVNEAPALPKTIVPDMRPTPVVRVLSPLGVEYVFLTLTLFVGAFALIGCLLTFVNSASDLSVLAFPASTLLVTLPVFAVLFLHLKRLEVRDPSLRFDASKRRSTQFSQIFSFIISLFTLIGLVYSLIANASGQTIIPIRKEVLDAVVVLVVTGGILFYYWRDEHKVRG